VELAVYHLLISLDNPHAIVPYNALHHIMEAAVADQAQHRHLGLLRLSICTPIADFGLRLAASFENYPTTCCLKISVVCKAQE
jgi:hypothetical protein